MTLFLAAAASEMIGQPHTTWDWTLAIVKIVLIDVVLAGDNAVVIALAVRQLHGRQRLLGIMLGSGVAVSLRVVLTFFAGRLLAMDYVKMVGGALVIWIAVKLLSDNTGHGDEKDTGKSASGLWSAIWLILVADITMSIDNVLAVAAASKGNFALLLFGLGLSIPLVVFTSNLLSKLMDRYAMIVWVGAAILGNVGGEMIATDHTFFPVGHVPEPWLVHSAGVFAALLVVGIGLALRQKRAGRLPEEK